VSVSAETIEWLFQTLDPEILVVKAADVVLQECDCDASAILLVNETGQLEVTSCSKREHLSGLAPSKRLLELLGSEAIRTDAIVRIDRDGKGMLPIHHALHDEGFRLVLAVPLHHSAATQPLGVLALLWRSTAPLNQTAPCTATSFARYLAIALTNARRQAASERERRYYGELIDQVGEALIVIDAETLIIEQSNHAADQLCGYSAADLKGRAIESIVAYARNQRQTLRGIRGQIHLDGELHHRDGSMLPIAIHATEILGERQLVILCLHDLNEPRRSMQQLIMAERIACMNRMTAIIAHEMNNPLQALANALQLLGRPLEPEKHARYLSMAQKEIDRLIRVVRRALDMHRPTRAGQRPIAVHSLLGDVIEQLTPLAEQQRVAIVCDIAQGGQWVVGIGSHLREVFLSLALNALEAMPAGGQFTIRTHIDTEVTNRHEQMVVIEFTDTGSGIPEEHVQEIFEPFYTTKNGNAGLGLAICYSIIDHHSGRLTVRTSEQGATFQVDLPAISSSESP